MSGSGSRSRRPRAPGRRLKNCSRSTASWSPDARGDADRILAEARRVSEAQRERAKEETEADRQRRLEETKRLIEAETQRALEQIRAEVADLTLIATERITGKVLDDEDHRRLIDEAVEGLDFSVLEESGRR